MSGSSSFTQEQTEHLDETFALLGTASLAYSAGASPPSITEATATTSSHCGAIDSRHLPMEDEVQSANLDVPPLKDYGTSGASSNVKASRKKRGKNALQEKGLRQACHRPAECQRR